MSDILISQDKSKLNLDVIFGFLQTAYWSIGRTRTMVKETIENSICFGVYKDDKQIGFARIISDNVVFAYLMDVFILPEHRGNGYGCAMLDHILNSPDLKHVQKWLLATSDAHGLYKKFGFNQLKHPEKLMGKNFLAE